MDRKHIIEDREHLVQLSRADVELLRAWLERPNGSAPMPPACRARFDAVEGGRVLVRTQPYKYEAPQLPPF